MADPYRSIGNGLGSVTTSVNGVAKAIAAASKGGEEAGRRRPLDLNLLTSKEVAELRLLVMHEGELPGWATARVKAGGKRVDGMY